MHVHFYSFVGFSEGSLPEIEGVNLDDELLEALKIPLIDVSRQRLRAIQISFRRLGNLENQITSKELNSVLSEHNIKMPGRTFQLILKKFEGKYGVDFEPLWKFMVQAQSRTGKFPNQSLFLGSYCYTSCTCTLIG